MTNRENILKIIKKNTNSIIHESKLINLMTEKKGRKKLSIQLYYLNLILVV